MAFQGRFEVPQHPLFRLVSELVLAVG